MFKGETNMMTKMQFACEVMKSHSKIEGVRKMLDTSEYHLMSLYVETDKKKDIIDSVVEGMSYEIANRVLGNWYDQGILKIVVKNNVSMLLSKTVCDWFAINEALKVLEASCVEFEED